MLLQKFAALACLAFVSCHALPEDRAVKNPRTPNQILDAVAERAVQYLNALGWGESKKVRNGYSDLPLLVQEYQDTTERFSIANAFITNLKSLRRSKSASFASSKSRLLGTIKFDNLNTIADYNVYFSGVGHAAPDQTSGRVQLQVSTIFVDLELSLDSNLVPQNIISYSVRRGSDRLVQLTNMQNNPLAKLQVAGFRKALLHLVAQTLNTNVKVQVNKAITAWKSEASTR